MDQQFQDVPSTDAWQDVVEELKETFTLLTITHIVSGSDRLQQDRIMPPLVVGPYYHLQVGVVSLTFCRVSILADSNFKLS